MAPIADEQLAHRIEYMSEYPVLQCPDWCTQRWNEDWWELHFGAWEPILEFSHGDGVIIWGRPVREWFYESDHRPGRDDADSKYWVQLATTTNDGDEGEPDPIAEDMAIIGMLDAEEIDALIAGVDDIRDKAAMRAYGVEWVWAFPGADDLAAGDEEEAGQAHAS